VQTSRRQLLGGAAATGAGLLLPVGEAASETAQAPGVVAASPEVVRRGRAIATDPRGRVLLAAHARRRTVAITDRRRHRTRLIELRGQPLEVAVSPDGRLGAVTTAYWEEPGLVLLDLPGGNIRARIDAGPAPFAVAFSRGGRHVLVSGGEQEGTLRVVDIAAARVVGTTGLGRVPRGVAIGRRFAWVALQGDALALGVDPRTGRIGRRVATPPYPHAVAESPDGRRLLVGHRSGASEIKLPHGRPRSLASGAHPSAVAYTRRGTRLIALGDSTEVLAIPVRRRRRRHRVQPGPRGLALGGPHAFTVSALTGSVSRFRP
jgi:DNA-binding beta-propeller fold protein YncE